MPLITLDVEKISLALNPSWRTEVAVYCFMSLASSNAYALTKVPALDYWQLYVAEQQTAGRGRLGRHWHSPAFENIYLSLSWVFALNASQQRNLAALSLVAGLSVVSMLKKLIPTVNWQVKWPNDIWGNGQKVAGILLESQKVGSLTQLVLGLGLNVNSSDFSLVERVPSPSSLYLLTQQTFDRNALVALVVNQLLSDIQQFFQAGLPAFKERWLAADGLMGQALSITTAKGQEHGIARGIDEAGYLLIEQDNGQLIACSVGEVQLLK